jgi:hypothetical protein
MELPYQVNWRVSWPNGVATVSKVKHRRDSKTRSIGVSGDRLVMLVTTAYFLL